MVDESWDGRSFLATVLAAFLRSLIGGICSRVVLGGKTETVAVKVLLLSVVALVLDRSFMVVIVKQVRKLAVLDSRVSQVARCQTKLLAVARRKAV